MARLNNRRRCSPPPPALKPPKRRPVVPPVTSKTPAPRIKPAPLPVPAPRPPATRPSSRANPLGESRMRQWPLLYHHPKTTGPRPKGRRQRNRMTKRRRGTRPSNSIGSAWCETTGCPRHCVRLPTSSPPSTGPSARKSPHFCPHKRHPAQRTGIPYRNYDPNQHRQDAPC